MDAERYRRIASIFGSALDVDAAARARHVEDACDGDTDLRREVEMLLDEACRSSTFLGSVMRRSVDPAALDALPLPERLGDFTIVGFLGSGGMGEVYLAEQQRPHRRVALKVIRSEYSDDSVIRRFLHEAELLARINHPGIAQIYQAGHLDLPRGSRPYIAMQLVEGETLAQRTRSDTTTPRTRAEVMVAVALVQRVAESLHAAHELGIVHRDVKPQNIMITPAGDPVLLDFGVARDVAGELNTLTLTGEQIGTPAYMSPEQAAGRREQIDRRSDVWSAGVVLYELLSGARPFDRPNRAATFDAIARAPLPDVRKLNPAVSRDLATVIETALERDLSRRYQSALAFAEDLGRVRRHEPVSARPASAWIRLVRWSQRHPAVAASLAVTIVALAAGLGSSLHLLSKEQSARREIQEESDSRLIMDQLRRAEDLWPVLPGTVPAIDEWLRESRLLDARVVEHLELRAKGAQRRALDSIAGSAAALRSAIRDVEARREAALRIGAESLEAAASRWKACIERLPAVPAYAGLAIEPQIGLVPLGFDSASGLCEFWVAGTGGPPDWGGSFEAGRAGIDEGAAMIVVLLRGGAFRRGAQKTDASGYRFDPEAEPQEAVELGRSVDIAPFFISKFEITQAQWVRIMGSNPSYCRPGTAELTGTFTLLHPVEQVSYDAALEFARRIGHTLPFEAQWEFAARGGTDTPYWTGATASTLHGAENIADAAFTRVMQGLVDPRGNAPDDGFGFSAPVGSFPPNPFGLHDMLGNVREWCIDLYNPGNGSRLMRGGSWQHDTHAARASWRFGEGRATAWGAYGVRTVRPLVTAPSRGTPR